MSVCICVKDNGIRVVRQLVFKQRSYHGFHSCTLCWHQDSCKAHVINDDKEIVMPVHRCRHGHKVSVDQLKRFGGPNQIP